MVVCFSMTPNFKLTYCKEREHLDDLCQELEGNGPFSAVQVGTMM